MHKTLADARKKLKTVLGKAAPKYDNPAELAADKGYHSRDALVRLDSAYRGRICEPERKGIAHWHGDAEARRAVYNNRSRLQSARGKSLQRLRSERVERSFAHCLDCGGMRRVHLRGDENIEKRYIIHVAGFNLGILMRSLFGVGTPKGWADAPVVLVFVRFQDNYCLFVLFCDPENCDQTKFVGGIAVSWKK